MCRTIMRRSLVTAAAAVLVLGLSACGGQRVPERGTVIDRSFHNSWIQVIPGITTCSDKGCTTTPMRTVYHPATWKITIQDLNNKEWKGIVTDYNPDTYNKCRKGHRWPDCWKGGQW